MAQDETVRHVSMRLTCPELRQEAIVSVIERVQANGAVRFVLWCSLRHDGRCRECCLAAPAGEEADAEGERIPATTHCNSPGGFSARVASLFATPLDHARPP